jgi:hypothetical protein
MTLGMTPRAIRRVPPIRGPIILGLVVVLLSACAGAPAHDPNPGSPGHPPPAQSSSAAAITSSASPTEALPALPAATPPAWPAPTPPAPEAEAAPVQARHAVPDPPARSGSFAFDLYRRGDFVSQARSDWCVPAAILTMANLVDRHNRSSLPSQRVLDRRSRALSSPRLVGAGSEPQGWAGVLDGLGYGPYAVVTRRTRQAAIATAALAIRRTGRPVGLLVWRGAHAWVLSGFEATADPALTRDFKVTAVRVSDPWYPRSSSAWGPTRGPDSRLSMAALAQTYLRWHRPTVRYAELDGRYVLVLPVASSSSR